MDRNVSFTGLSLKIEIKITVKIKLNSGKEVILNAFNISQTYGGYIEGIIDRKYNLSVLDGSKPYEAKGISYPKEWGERKHLAIRPSEEEINTRLKPFFISAWLESGPIDENEGQGSELEITWTAEISEQQTLQEIVESGIKDIDWNANADDFSL